MKKIIFLIWVVLIIGIFSCQKQVDYQPQINSLNSNITALQKSRDSLAAALAQTNNNLNTTNINVAALSKSLDSIKVQLTSIGTQIATLNSQMASANANIATLTAQIAALNLQYTDLLSKYNSIILQLAPSTLNSGLVAYYPFNGNANDSSLIGNNGKVVGASLTTDRFSKTNSAYLFNDNYIIIPNNKAYEFNNYTISFWASTTSTSKQVPIIKLNYDDAKNEQFAFVFNDLSPNGFQFAAKFNNVNCTPGIGWQKNEYIKSLADGNFHHYVGSVDGDIINLYIDGLLVKTIIGPSKVSSSCFGGDIQIGRDWKSFNDYFQGKIDDVRIYNRVLNIVEISYLSSH
jgi:cell division protein FtsB